MSRKGILTPAESGKFIAEQSKYVTIHEECFDKICDEMMNSMKDHKLEIPDTGTDIIHANREYSKAVDWVFMADALNFCFWSYSGALKWTVDGQSGYYALEAALSRAIKEDYDITNPEFYSKITEEEFRKIMRGDNEAPLPLFAERIKVLHEVGTILLDKYNGTFETCLKEANKSAVKLLEIIVENFPCFRDEAFYKEKTVSFYKRAQILVADIWNFFGGKDCGEFHDINKMTMFADYRVPQVLVYFGIMSYSLELMDKLRKDILLPSGSLEEVEIRGCSIHAVELLKKRIAERIRMSQQNIEVPNSSLIDYYLWCYRRKHESKLEAIPFHKTLSIFY